MLTHPHPGGMRRKIVVKGMEKKKNHHATAKDCMQFDRALQPYTVTKF